MTLEEMRLVDVRTVPKSELFDMGELKLPEMKDTYEALDFLLSKHINWYVHKRGNIAIENVYTEGKTINDIFGIMIASSS